MRATFLIAAFLLLGIGATASGQTTAAQCSGLTTLQVPGFAVEITRAEWLTPAAGIRGPW